MSIVLALVASLVSPAHACAMEPMEYKAVAEAPTPTPAPTLADVFAEIDAAAAAPVAAPTVAQQAQDTVHAVMNKARAVGVATIPELGAKPPVSTPPTARPAS